MNIINEETTESQTVFKGAIFEIHKDKAKIANGEIKNREVKKTYLAVVHGNIKEEDTLINYISKDNKTNSSYIDNKNGKESILSYNRLKYDKENDLSLVKVNLKTGRHHQIRLQMSNINHPLYGDQRYGKEDKNFYYWTY